VAIGDYDNDGFKDIFVGAFTQSPVPQQRRRHLHRRHGESRLAKPDKEYGPLWSVGGAW